MRAQRAIRPDQSFRAGAGHSPRRRSVVAPPMKPDLLRLSLSALIIMSVSHVQQMYGWLAIFRPGQLFVGLSILAALMNRRALANGWSKRWPAKMMIAITAAACGSIVFGISQGGAFFYFSQYFSKVLIAAFLLMAAMRDARDLRIFVWAYVIGTAVLVWMALFVFQLSATNTGMMRLSGLETWDANDMCVLLVIGMALCVLLFQTAGPRGKIAAGITLIGIGAAIARSGSRGGFLGLGCVVVALLLSLKGTSMARRLTMLGGFAAGLVLAAPKGYWQQMNTITSAEQDYNWDSEDGRRMLAIQGLKYMIQYPVFGIGINNFGRATVTISDRALHWDPSQPGIKASVAHNTYIQAGAELGIPGGFLMIALVLGCIMAPWRLRRRIPPAWAQGTWDQQFLYHATLYLPVAALGFAVTAFFVSFAYNDPLYILAAMVCALTASVEAGLNGPRRSAAMTAKRPNSAAPGRRVGPLLATRGPIAPANAALLRASGRLPSSTAVHRRRS